MFCKKIIFVFCLACIPTNLFSQKDSVNVKGVKVKGALQIEKGGVYDALAPSKAAFYSAIFPGMGQIYNKKYWKAPIVWGALAIPTYFYLQNNNDYKRFRRAYQLRLNGQIDEFTSVTNNGSTIIKEELLSLETLERAQEQLRENRDMSLLSGVILYVLQIVEASVNAHLLQFNTDDNLSIRPSLLMNPIRIEAPSVGLTFNYTF